MSVLARKGVWLCGLLLASACSNGGGGKKHDGISVSRAVGTQGGTVTLGESVTLDIPAGALAEETEITVSEINDTPDAFLALSKVFQFEPAGLTFAVPAKVELSYSPSALQNEEWETGAKVYWTDSEGSYQPLESEVAAEENHVTANIDHFSKGAAGLPPNGACCYDQVCSQATEEDCLGVFVGNGVACEPINPCCAGSCEGKACDEDDGCGRLCGCPDYLACYEGTCWERHACCGLSGECTLVVTPECAPNGWLIPDTEACADNLCDVPLGACCPPESTGLDCELMPESSCFSGQGSIWKDGMGCDPDPCTTAGACCHDDESCTSETFRQCSSSIGVYQGAGVACTENLCSTTGACCYNDGSCTSDTIAGCDNTGGTYQGAAVACTEELCPCIPQCPNNGTCPSDGCGGTCGCPDNQDCSEGSCLVRHACCDLSGECTVAAYVNCAPNGYPLQDQLVCSEGLCDQPLGACCPPQFIGGDCELMPEGTCYAGEGSIWKGAIDCDPDPCTTAGACCHDDGSCTSETFLECSSSYGDGDYQGAYVACSEGLCPCMPSCPDDDTCPSDGCGGTCLCSLDLVCNSEGLCVPPSPYLSPISLVTGPELILFGPVPDLYESDVLQTAGSGGASIGLFDPATGAQIFHDSSLNAYAIHLIQHPLGPWTLVGCGASSCFFKTRDDTSGWEVMTNGLPFLGNITDMVPLPDASPKRIVYVSNDYNQIALLHTVDSTGMGVPGWENESTLVLGGGLSGANGNLISAWGPDYATKALLMVTVGGDLWWIDNWGTGTASQVATDLGSDLRRVRCVDDHCGITDFGSSDLTLVRWSSPDAAPEVMGTQAVGNGAVGLDIRKDGDNWLYLSTGYNDDTYTITTVDADFSVVSSTTTALEGCSEPGHASFNTDPSVRYLVVSCHGSDAAVILEY